MVTGLAAALLLAGCGEVPDGGAEPGAPDDDPGTTAPDGEAAAVAPYCDDVDELVAQPAPDGEVAGSTATPQDGPELPDDASGTSADSGWISEDIEAWARANAPDAYAGLWLDRSIGGMAVAFTRDVDDLAAAIRAEVHPGIAVAEAANSEQDLRALQDQVTARESPDGGIGSGDVVTTGSGNLLNRLTVGVYDPTEDRLAELSAAYGADLICFEIHDAPPAPSDTVTTLAKVDGHREDVVMGDAVLEVAYDRETAERAWAENVPDDLAAVDADPPAETGVYADLDAVDFERQAIVVWSSGQSGSCPSYLADLDVVDGEVALGAAAVGGGVCTMDYNPFRVVAAVDRDRLPAEADLPLPIADAPDGQAVAYPEAD